uniref:COI1 F-box domain-containing protein n=1 Tax=Ananas comosus var. bracteatus TaxID=296719 RepID=A0A6V7QWT7_ANACO
MAAAAEQRRLSSGWPPDAALDLVLGYVDDPRDREAASLVCSNWHRIDALSRSTTGGGYAGPWIAEIAASFDCLKELHLRRMIVADADLAVLVKARGHMLQSLKLDKCSGSPPTPLR